MKMKNSIRVFIPALNEERNIKKSILDINKYLKSRFKDYEIVVVINGSTDNTEEIVKRIIKKNKKIKLVKGKKKGYGLAIRAGFYKNKKDFVFYTDSDNQFDISELDTLLPMMTKYDVVSAYRRNRKDSFPRIFTAYVYNILINIIFNLWIKDIDASFKIYKKEVIDKMKLISETGLIDAEMLIKAKRNGFKIGQVGVTHYPRKEGIAFYEVGVNNHLAFVRPKVVFEILGEIKSLIINLNKNVR